MPSRPASATPGLRIQQPLAPGRRFMEHAQRLQQAVMDARSGRSDVVTIGAINSAMFDIMPRLTRTAKQLYPQLSLAVMEMQSSDALAAVQSGEIDIALARFDDQMASPAKNSQIRLRSGVIPHIRVHRRRQHNASGEGQIRGGKKIVGQSVGKFRQQVRSGRGDHQNVVFLGHANVLDRA